MRIFSRGKKHGSSCAQHARSRLRRDEGFTLFEVLIAAVVLVLGLTALFGLLDTSLKASASTRAREGATNLAREILEDARTIPFSQLAPASIVGELQAMNGLADGSGTAGWQVLRRGVTYTVTASDCSIDDPKDEYGEHVSGVGSNPFCAESSSTGTADPQPEDLKRITVDVTWVARGRTPAVHQVETLSAAGEAPGLTATELKLSSPVVTAPTSPLIAVQPAEDKLTFTVKSPTGTSAMSWSLDGVRQTSAVSFVSGTQWTFSWLIPTATVSDGTYQVSAQAIDATGVDGPPVSIGVTLIRGVPAAPKITYGGYNDIYVAGNKTKVAELQWQANAERNVIGYRVYNPSHQLICPANAATLSLAVSCIDENPPAPTGVVNRTYAVVALYRKAEGEGLSKEVFEGPEGTFTLASGPPLGPTFSGTLSAEKNADGSVTLKWPEPTGVAVVFYRIYRGSTDYTSRYGVASAATREFTDTAAATSHSYWVTAVSATLTESQFLGPVIQ